MHMATRVLRVLGALGVLLAARGGIALAAAWLRPSSEPGFVLADRPLGGSKPASATPAYLAAGLMTFDPISGAAYVADRRGDRIAVVRTPMMELASSIPTPAEPYGIAL